MKNYQALILIAAIFMMSACSHIQSKYPSLKDEWNFALYAAQNNLWKEARFRFENILKKEPNDVMARNNLAVALEALGEFSAAEREYKRALNIDPNNVVVKENHARLLAILKDKQSGKHTEQTKTE